MTGTVVFRDFDVTDALGGGDGGRRVQQAVCFETHSRICPRDRIKEITTLDPDTVEREQPFVKYGAGYLAPCSDLAVFLVTAYTSRRLFLEVWMRQSHHRGFVRVRRIRMQNATNIPSHLPFGMPATQSDMFPKAHSFSPCGRYLLLVYYDTQDTTSFRAKSGIYVMDLAHTSMFEGVPDAALTREIIWIACSIHNLPKAIQWNAAGLWVQTRSGTILLGV